MPKTDPVLTKIRRICLSLPDTKQTITWGKPHFRVGDKIFAGFGQEDGKPVLGFKLEMKHAKAIVKLPGFWRAPYVGNKGWVSMDASEIKDWEAVREMIHESYQLIAPNKSLAKLPEVAVDKVTKKKNTTKRKSAKKTDTPKSTAKSTAARKKKSTRKSP